MFRVALIAAAGLALVAAPAAAQSWGGTYDSGYGSRSDWCRANYRSYDPRTGYYRAYSGRRMYCG